MSWLLAALGFVVLIILHEFGHFAVAKAVGMKVERFSLFFPPLLVRKKIGETEYAIGAIPAGGYVRITGMNPSEQLSDEERTRAYYSQPVWKRIAVIAAGPAMNFVIGFILFVVFFWLVGADSAAPTVQSVTKGFPAAGQLQSGDKVVSIDGRRGSVDSLSKVVEADKCPGGAKVQGCAGARVLTVVVDRHGRPVTLHIRPVYDSVNKRTRLGFAWGTKHVPEGFSAAVSDSADRVWYATHVTASLPVRLFNPQQRAQIHGIVGSYETTRQTILQDPGDTVGLLAVISIALAVVNLFPFLPLDGGHIFWGVVELVRRRPVPFSTMERASFVGFALVMMLFVLGLTNDIHTLSNGGFQPAH